MRLVVVVAHPDDETFGCGSLLLHARAAGYDTAVVCATRGEAGETRVATDDLAALREAELREAARALGVGEVRVLGFADSGMDGPAPPGALVDADPAAVAAAVGLALADLGADVVVTLDASDGHRDHAAIRDATLAAVEAAVVAPSATYLWCLARSSMDRFLPELAGQLGTPDELVTTVLDVADHLDARWAAMAAHRSQANPYDDMAPDLQRDFLATERLLLVAGEDVLGPAAP